MCLLEMIKKVNSHFIYLVQELVNISPWHKYKSSFVLALTTNNSP